MTYSCNLGAFHVWTLTMPTSKAASHWSRTSCATELPADALPDSSNFESIEMILMPYAGI